MIQNGSSVLVFDANGAPIACQRNVDVTFNDDMIDVTCKQDNGFSTFLLGKRSFSMTCEALTDWGQNLLFWSEEFDNVVWAASNVVVTADATTAPDGTTTADRIQGTGVSDINQNATVVAQDYTLSFWAKTVSGLNETIRFRFDSGASPDITITGDWVRYEYTATCVGGSATFGITRDSSNNDFDLYIWGAQLNTGTTAQSYYKTTSTVNPNIDTLVSANLNRTKVELNIANPAFDDIYFNGEAYVESIELNAGTETEASYTVTFSGTADLVSLVS